jgi:hypothetical protein
MRTELKEKDLLKALIKGLREAKVKEKELMNGLIDTLDQMKKTHFPADFTWATKMVFLIIGGWPDIMNKNNQAFTLFCNSLPQTEVPVLKKWERDLFNGDAELRQPKSGMKLTRNR